MLTPRRLTELGRVAEVAPSPDGSWLAVTVGRLDDDDAKYLNDLYRVPLSGGEPVKLTSGPYNDRAPRFRDDGALLFLSNRAQGKSPDEGEDERSQIWVLPATGGEPRRMTDEPLGISAFRTTGNVIAAIAPVWPGVEHEEQREHAKSTKKNGPSILRYTDMPVRHWDHWHPIAAPHLIAFDSHGGGRRDLTPSFDRELRPEPELHLSEDGVFAIVTVSTPHEADRLESMCLRRVELKSGEYTDLGAGIRGWYGSACISPSTKRIACVRGKRFDDRCVERELVVFEEGRDEPRVIADNWDRWPSPACFLDEDRLVVTYDDHGEVRLATVTVTDGSRIELGVHGSYSGVELLENGGFVAVGHSLTQPPRPVHISGGERTWLPELSGIVGDEIEGCQVEVFEVEASDGARIETRFVKPEGEGPFPTVLWIHGGPISHFGNQWHWRWNPLVLLDRGYAIALPNARGSTGYGYDFISAIWGNTWGGQCFDDLMRVSDALAVRDDVAETKMAAMGGSFGGYMTNWIGGQTDRFAALVTHASVFDFRAFYGATDHPAYWALMQDSTPWKGEIDTYSPHRFVPRWKSPTLVLHGERDYRVPIGEALALFEGLRAHDVDSELVVFPDENHWILKPRNIRAWYDTVIAFLDKHLA